MGNWQRVCGVAALGLSCTGAADTCADTTCARRSALHPYPTRGADNNRSGYAREVSMPFPLPATPSWVVEIPSVNRHQTPAIDGKRNVYVGSDGGIVQSFDAKGQHRWTTRLGAAFASNPTLADDGVLYTAMSGGMAIALDMGTGIELWRAQISQALPSDPLTPTVFEDVLIYPAGGVKPFGATHVVCLSRKDGSVRWRYNVVDTYGPFTGEFAKNGIGPKHVIVNFAPCVWGDGVIFSDVSGTVYRLSLRDGSEIWRSPGDDEGFFTLGGVCCGPNGKVYRGFVPAFGQGVLDALDVHTGRRLWRRTYPQEVHAAPGVGYMDGVLTVVVGVGKPADYPETPDPWLSWSQYLARKMGFGPKYNWTGHVDALDAETGAIRWTFAPPPWRQSGSAGSTWEVVCLPDLFSAPTIDAVGVVWINWSAGGVLYGLADTNQNGIVELDDPSETTSYDCGSAATGPPGVAENMVFVTTCRRLVAFVAK